MQNPSVIAILCRSFVRGSRFDESAAHKARQEGYNPPIKQRQRFGEVTYRTNPVCDRIKVNYSIATITPEPLRIPNSGEPGNASSGRVTLVEAKRILGLEEPL